MNRPQHISIFISALCLPLTAIAQDDNRQNQDEVIVSGIYNQAADVAARPASLDVIDTQQLTRISAVHPAEALNTVAGVNIHRGSGQEHLTAIRSPVLTGGAGAGSFLYLEDGVPLRAAGFANVNGLFEGGTDFAKSIEVLKGPGPAEYGSNAVHGVINIGSADINDPNRIKLMGSDDGFASLTLAQTMGDFRASVSLAHDNGFREDSGFDQQKFQLKYSGGFGPWSVDWLSSFNNLNQETAGFIQGDDAFRDKDIARSNPNPEAFRDGKSYRTQARFARNLGDYTLALTPYARRAELRFLRHFVPGQALEKNGHSSVGLQSALYDDSLNVGFDVEYSDGFLFEFQDNPSRFSFVQGLHYDYEVEAVVIAAYAQKTFALGEALTLDIGARAEYTHYDYDNQANDGRSGRFIRSPDRTDDFLTLTPKLSLSYSSDAGLFYARAARGSRAPQVTDLYSVQLNQVAGAADVETLDSVELGYKYTGRVSMELAAFAMKKDNFFFRNANGFNVTNGKTSHIGIEAAVDFEITPWLRAGFNGTLADHRYAFDLDEGSAANTITDGTRVDSAPDTLATTTLTADVTNTVELGLEWRHVGSYFTNPGNTAQYNGHDIFVGRVSYDLSDAIRLFGRVDNVFDERYADRADFAFGNERYFPGRPRTVFFGLTAAY
ncbi:TonB-dependent receptor [Fretibacter rubidus]|uniref:TonB-dependent receptor n=1 Tax=Fretibacter rubidus TaxID=570162 RepID=UPI00352BB0E5